MPLLAVTAYEAGQITGAVIPLAVGIALVAVGLRRRRASTSVWSFGGPATEAPGFAGGTPATPQEDAPSWTPQPELEDPVEASPPAATAVGRPVASPPVGWPAVEPVRSRGTGLIVGGAALVALTLLGGALLLADRAASQRTIALPTAVLGLARDEAASLQVGKSALATVPAGLSDPQTAVYGTLPNAILVIAAKAHTSRPDSQLEGFRKGIEQSGGTLEKGRDVPAGTLGGAARCWEAVLNGVRPGLCVFVDRGSLVATIDFLGGGLDAAAKRGRQVREATVSKK